MILGINFFQNIFEFLKTNISEMCQKQFRILSQISQKFIRDFKDFNMQMYIQNPDKHLKWSSSQKELQLQLVYCFCKKLLMTSLTWFWVTPHFTYVIYNGLK